MKSLNYKETPKQPHVMPKANTNLHEIAPETVYSMFQGLKINKSAGSDRLTPYLNSKNSLQSHNVQSLMKHKNLSFHLYCTNTKNNLRPIDMLPVMGEILKRTVIKINQAQLVENFSLNQHACRRLSSCTSAIVDTTQSPVCWNKH